MSSWIFVPGNSEKFLSKASSLEASTVVYDLEDSVLPGDKQKAVALVNDSMKSFKSDSRQFVRVNGVHTPYFLSDITQLNLDLLDGIMVPKVNSLEDMIIIDYLLTQMEVRHRLTPDSVKVIPLIESGAGVNSSNIIACTSKRVEALAFGSEDYKLELNIGSDDSCILDYARSQLVNASNAAAISPPIDGVYTDFNDQEGLKLSSQKSKKNGFQGRLIIHPKQLDVSNTAYRPSEEEIEEAKKIIEAYDQSVKDGSGAVGLNGKMIDPPVADRARKLIDNL